MSKVSICEFHPQYRKHIQTTPEDRPEQINIQDELLWGVSYRTFKKALRDKMGVSVKKSPIDIPFKICREKQRMAKKTKRKSKMQKTAPVQRKVKKLSLLEKSVLTQPKYMDYLATPNPKYEERPPKRPKKCRCELEPCPPRLVQLAVPNKRRVFANWKDYQHLLPVEMIMRFEEILHTEKSLDPRDARYYYKKLDKLKRKKMREKKRLQRKKREEKEKGTKKWLNDQIANLTKVIMEFIKEEPLFMLNYKQLLLSDGILELLDEKKVLKKPARTTKKPYKKTLIEVSDKIAIWMDTLIRFVDIQAVDSKEDIPPVVLPSLTDLAEEGEGEGEESEIETESSEETESEEDKEGEDRELLKMFYGEGEDIIYEGEEEYFVEGTDVEGIGQKRSAARSMRSQSSKLSAKKTKSKASEFDMGEEDEGEGGAEDWLAAISEFDIDTLNKLIEILAKCSSEFLQQPIDEEKAPGVTYNDLLEKLIEMRDSMTVPEPKSTFLEDLMIKWAMQNEPDQVDDKLVQKIREMAMILDEWLKCQKEGKAISEGRSVRSMKKSASSKVGMSGEEGEGEGEGEMSSKISEGAIKAESGQFSVGSSKQMPESTVSGKSIGTMEGESTAPSSGLFGEGEFGVSSAQISAGLEGEEGYDKSSKLLSEGYEGEEGMEMGGMEEGPGMVGVPGIKGVGEEERRKGVCGVESIDVLKSHTAPKVTEHSPDMVCCMSLKIWAVWLMEITHNAHNWTRWVYDIIKKVKEFAATVRGEVTLPNGEKKVLRKSEWRQFVKDTEEKVVTWRAYSQHVKELTDEIISNYRGKKVMCCPKCLQDNLIKDVVYAHETFRSLTEAMNCASYWQRNLNSLVETTADLTGVDKRAEVSSSSSSESVELEGLVACVCKKVRQAQALREEESGESLYEIEEILASPEQEQGLEQAGPSGVLMDQTGVQQATTGMQHGPTGMQQSPFQAQFVQQQFPFGPQHGAFGQQDPFGPQQGPFGPQPGPSGRSKTCRPRQYKKF